MDNIKEYMCSALFEIICENGLYWLCQIIFANQFTEGISFGEANINGKVLPFSNSDAHKYWLYERL